MVSVFLLGIGIWALAYLTITSVEEAHDSGAILPAWILRRSLGNGFIASTMIYTALGIFLEGLVWWHLALMLPVTVTIYLSVYMGLKRNQVGRKHQEGKGIDLSGKRNDLSPRSDKP